MVPMMSASLLILSSGCASFSSSTPIPDLPEHLKTCAEKYGIPVELPEGPYSSADAIEQLSRVRVSELGATRCLSDLVAFYRDLVTIRNSLDSQP